MNPIAFTLFGIDVRWYGIFIGIGALLGVYLAEYLSKKNTRVPNEAVSDYALIALFLGILGARLYYVAFEWDYYSQHTNEILAIRNGGLAIHGGILAGIGVAYIFCKIRKIPFWELLDMIAPSMALAQGIGRWGNFANGEAHGGPTNLPWAIDVGGQMVHPTFLYESIWDVGIFIFLFFFLSKKRKFPGQMATLYIVLYSIGRFMIESLRTDSLYFGPIKTAQLISVIGIVIALLFYFIESKKSDPSKYKLI